MKDTSARYACVVDAPDRQGFLNDPCHMIRILSARALTRTV